MGIHLAGLPDLTGLRRSKGVTLQGIAQSSKICVRYLEAIEQGNFGKLPGGLYDLSYIRQYAQAIDLPESSLVELYYDTVGHPKPDPALAVIDDPPPSHIARLLHIVSARKLRKTLEGIL